MIALELHFTNGSDSRTVTLKPSTEEEIELLRMAFAGRVIRNPTINKDNGEVTLTSEKPGAELRS